MADDRPGADEPIGHKFVTMMTGDNPGMIFLPRCPEPSIRYIRSDLMKRCRRHNVDELDVELVPLALPLDRETISWLNGMSRDDVEAAVKIAEMLRMIREDDERADQTLH